MKNIFASILWVVSTVGLSVLGGTDLSYLINSKSSIESDSAIAFIGGVEKYNSSTNYEKGVFVLKDNAMYKSKETISAGDRWDISKWEKIDTRYVNEQEARCAARQESIANRPRRLGPYLWEMSNEGEDWVAATNRIAQIFPSYGGRCSGVCNTRLHGRNLDWEYNREATVIVRAPASDYPGEQRLSAIGITGCNKAITEEFLLSGKWSEAYYSLPFMWCDGMNECGVVIQQNVLQTNYSYSAAWRTRGEGKIICFCIIRYVLARSYSAEEAARMICDLNFIPAEYEYDFHYLVSDKSNSFIVEDGCVYYKDGRVYKGGEIKSGDPRPTDVMTNFRIGGSVLFTDDGMVDWNTVGGDEEGHGAYDRYGMGLERYDLVRNKKYDMKTIDGMLSMMKDLWYTKAYELENWWCTEYCTPSNEQFNVYNAKRKSEIFEEEILRWRDMKEEDHTEDSEQYRSGRTWQTTHTAIYDKEKLKIHLLSQEDESKVRVFDLINNQQVQETYSISTNDVYNIVSNQYNETKKNSSYLSVWDCSTGKPITNPTQKNYAYQKGDFYVVGNVANGMFEHNIEMSGYTRGAGFVYTNLVFSFTNNVKAGYKSFDDVIEAAEKIKSGSKTAFSANGKVIDPFQLEEEVKYVDPICLDINYLQLVDSSGSARGSDWQATNAIFLCDTVINIGQKYRPDGSVYTNGSTSSCVERENVQNNDSYYFDGVDWILLHSPSEESIVAATNALPEWTKTETKPIYTASEVGAVPVAGGVYTGEVRVISYEDNSKLRLIANRIAIAVTTDTARVTAKNTAKDTRASIRADEEKALLSLDGKAFGIDIDHTGKISTRDGNQIQIPTGKDGTLVIDSDLYNATNEIWKAIREVNSNLEFSLGGGK